MSSSGTSSQISDRADDAFSRIADADRIHFSGVDVADMLLLFTEISNVNTQITQVLAKMAAGEIKSEDIKNVEELCNRLKDEISFLAIELAQNLRSSNEQS